LWLCATCRASNAATALRRAPVATVAAIIIHRAECCGSAYAIIIIIIIIKAVSEKTGTGGVPI